MKFLEILPSVGIQIVAYHYYIEMKTDYIFSKAQVWI